MEMIRFNPKKLDAVADEYFASVQYYEDNPHLPVTKDYIERSTLAGIALRMWAERMRKANKRAKDKRLKPRVINTKEVMRLLPDFA